MSQSTEPRSRIQFTKLIKSISIVGLTTLAVACAKSGSINQPTSVEESGATAEVPFEPTEKLVPSAPPRPSKNGQAEIYEITDVKFGADKNLKAITARIDIRSAAGDEWIEMAGRIRADGSATLIDLKAREGDKHRLSAEAYCADFSSDSDCKQIILNIFFKVGKRVQKKQFVTEDLAKSNPYGDTGNSSSDHDQDPDEQGLDHGHDESADNVLTGANQQGEYVGAPRNEEMIKKLLELPERPEPIKAPVQNPTTQAAQKPAADAVPQPTAPVKPEIKPAAKPETPSAPANGQPSKQNQPPAQNPPQKPAAQPAPAKPTATQPQPEPVTPPVTAAAPAPQPAPKTPQPPAAPQSSKDSDDDDDDDVDTTAPANSTTAAAAPISARPVQATQPQTTKPAPVPAPQPAAAPAPSSSTKPAPPKSTAAPAAQPQSQAITQTKIPPVEPPVVPVKKTEVAKPQKAPTTPAKPPASSQPKPPPMTPVIPEAPPKDTYVDKLIALEREYAPMLELRDGGRAVGDIDNGRLEQATLLPNSGDSFKNVYPDRKTHWGTGMMISLLKNATASFAKQWFPGTVVMIGDISFEKGGKLNADHKSHQTGLDADIPYIGNSSFERVLDNQNRIRTNFDYVKNWQFFRMVANQKIIQDGKKITVLNRIFVNKAVKKALCEWAKNVDLLKDPADFDIMRRVQAWDGHDKHFHLRIRCSPHYPKCRNQPDPEEGKSGC